MSEFTPCAFNALRAPATIRPVVNPVLLNRLARWQIRCFERLNGLHVLGVNDFLIIHLANVDLANRLNQLLTTPLHGPAITEAATTSLNKRTWVNRAYGCALVRPRRA